MKTTVINDVFIVDSGAINSIFMVKNNKATVFDTGLTKDNARKLGKLIEVEVEKIINTHSHADHIGGNHFFENKFGCKSFINEKELSFCYLPELEASGLYGGSAFEQAKSKFLCAKPFKNIFPLHECGVESIELFGHSPGHTGFLINGVFYAGDAIFSEEVIEKHKILYLYDVENFQISLKKILEVDFEYIVFCHKGILTKEEVNELVELNLRHTNIVSDNILELIKKGNELTAEDITFKLMNMYDIPLGIEYVLLISSTVKGYLKLLNKQGKIELIISNGIKWKLI